MLTTIILNNEEPKVVEYTYELLWRELKDIENADLIISDNWFDDLEGIKNKFVCFVEADCLVNSGYFQSQVGLLQKNKYFRKLAMLASGVGVNAWHNKFYGYRLRIEKDEMVQPEKLKHSNTVYPIQIGFVPGAIIRKKMLVDAMDTLKLSMGTGSDLLLLSAMLSLEFWGQGDGNRVHINPNTTYVTTDTTVNDLGHFDDVFKVSKKVKDIFVKESI